MISIRRERFSREPLGAKAKVILIALFLVFGAWDSASGMPSSVPADEVPEVQCASTKDCFLQAKAVYQSGNIQHTITLLREILDQRPESPWIGRAKLLLARALEKSNDDEAVEYYREALDELPVLSDHILLALGRSYLKAGEPLKAAEVFEDLINQYPKSLLKSEALYLAAEAYVHASESSSAIRKQESFLQRYPSDPKSASVLYSMGVEHLKLDEMPRAIDVFRQMLWKYPYEPIVTSARTKLEDLAAQGIEVPDLTTEERFYRAEALYRATQYREAIEAFQESLESTEDNKIREESRLYLGICLVQIRRWSEAILTFEKILKNRPDPDVAGKALLWMGRAALRLDAPDKLLWVNKTLKKSYPDRPERASVLWFLAFYHESKKHYRKAIRVSEELIRLFPQDSLAEEAYWRIGWIHYQQGRGEAGLKALDGLLERYPESPFRPQALYWKAKMLENQGRRDGAQEVYTRLCREHSRTYYCHRARRDADPVLSMINQDEDGSAMAEHDRLRDLNSVSDTQMDTPGLPRDVGRIASDLRYKKANELMLIGFTEEAIQEFNALVASYTRNRQALLFLADRLYTLQAYGEALRIIRYYFREPLERGHSENSDRFWELAYPLGLINQITNMNGEEDLDPYLVASIIREESGYDPNAVSPAGAVGLMQLMPKTAHWVASKIGLDGFDYDKLVDPTMNIKLGTWYLAHLFKQFDNNIVFTIAAYNAGPEAVTEWISRPLYTNLDEFIEQIPYSETRLYVKRVLRSYYEYLFINASPSSVFLDKNIAPEYS